MEQQDHGRELLLLAALLSIQIAAGRSTTELAILSSLFSILGDNLALLAATRPDLSIQEPDAGGEQDRQQQKFDDTTQ